MNLDAAGDGARRTNAGSKDWRGGYIPGYDPDNDRFYDMAQRQHYDDDLRLASAEYWADLQGSELPTPSYGYYKDRLVLGRHMDVYMCQAMMRRAKHDWRLFFWKLCIGTGIFLLFGGTQPMIGIILFFPYIAAIVGAIAWYRHTKKHRYMIYYRAQSEAMRTGYPVWVPYDQDQLEAMYHDRRAQWP